MKKTDMIKTFLDKKLHDNPSTRNCYRVNIQTYFKLLKKDMNSYFSSDLNVYEDDLIDVYNILKKEQKRKALAIRTFFNGPKQFMFFYDKRLKDLDFWETLKARTKNAEPESDEAILNADDIKNILSHGNACSRALFLMLASSGRRIGEILALTPDDINTNAHPTTLNIKKGLDRDSTKSGQKTPICFISDEATTAYKTWMEERDEYLKASLNKGNTGKNKNDPRCFPFSYHNALTIWRNLLMRANLVKFERVKDKWTGKMNKKIIRSHRGERTLQHPHCLRKFYRSYLGDADLGEYLMGHGTMLTRAYRQMKKEDLAAKYSKLMPNVTIFESAPDLSGINKQLTNVVTENLQLKERLDLLEKIIRQKGNAALDELKGREKS